MSDRYLKAVRPCPTCGGITEHGRWDSDRPEVDCADCDDTGWQNVDVGERIQRFDTAYPGAGVLTDDFTRPKSWTLIRPGDTVLVGGEQARVIETYDAEWGGESVMVEFVDHLPTDIRWWDNDEHGQNRTVAAADLTLVCDGEPDHRFGVDTHPSWRWEA